MVAKDSFFVADFRCAYGEPIDSRGDDLSEALRKQNVFEPFCSPSLGRSFLFEGAFEYGLPGAVSDCFVGFK